MSDRLTIALNLAGKAPSQYVNMPFDSVVEFGGKVVFFGDTGIFEETGSTDNGVAIDWYVDTPLHDFGDRGQKSIEAYDVGYESAGNLTLTLTGDEDAANARSFTLAPVKAGQKQQDGMQTLTKYRYGNARYWQVRMAGSTDASLDYLALAPVFLKRRSL